MYQSDVIIRQIKESSASSLLIRVLMITLMSLPGILLAEDQEDNAGVTTQENEEVKDEDILDWHKRQVDTQVQRATQWVDSFFRDPNYEADVASSQFRLRPELYYRDQQGSKFRLKASLKLRLPNVSRKVSLVVGNHSDNENSGGSVDDSLDETVLGLQFFGKLRKNWHTSLSAGLKFNEFAFFAGPRARYDKAITERSSFRFTQAVRWQTNNHWQFISRVDLNYAFSDHFYFRQTVDGRWRGEKSDEEGYRTRISSFVTQGLNDASGLQYEFSTIFHTRPATHVDSYTVSLRYRKRSSKQWLYYEIVPQFAFEDEFDYKANPGIRLRLEFFYGADEHSKILKHEMEDTEDFRW